MQSILQQKSPDLELIHLEQVLRLARDRLAHTVLGARWNPVKIACAKRRSAIG